MGHFSSISGHLWDRFPEVDRKLREALPSPVKAVIRPILHLITRCPPRAIDPFATHIPVLIGLARLIKVERVLELGCGPHSTMTFLNPSTFPHLRELVSLENDPVWAESIRQCTRNDPRLNLILVNKPIWQALADVQCGGFDLFFIDDSSTIRDRTDSIREVVRKCRPAGGIVIHDYGTAAYRDASRSVAHRYTFTALNPYTGLLWDKLLIEPRRLKQINRFIRRHSDHFSPEDCKGWAKVMRHL